MHILCIISSPEKAGEAPREADRVIVLPRGGESDLTHRQVCNLINSEREIAKGWHCLNHCKWQMVISSALDIVRA